MEWYILKSVTILATLLLFYKLLLERFDLKADNKTYKELGFKDNLKTELISHALIGSAATLLLFGDKWSTNQKVEEKIARLNKLLSKK